MANFTGQLNTNEIFTAIYNMIIGQSVFSRNISGDSFASFVDRARMEGSMYGDTYLYYATDANRTFAFEPDTENQRNLLAVNRPASPKVQPITISVFRQIWTTIDNYFTKRAFSTETAFSDFNSVTLQWLRDTKRIYDETTYNAYLGTVETSIGKQQQTVTLTEITEAATTADEESYNRLVAQTIAEKVANILVELRDISKNYNDYGFYRSYSIDELVVVWNTDYINAITKLDLPTIFHNEGLMDKFSIDSALPSRYFGTVNAEGGTTGADNTSVRALIEKDYGDTHVFAGELLPNSTAYLANETYTVNDNVICKIMHKDSVPYMSGFETESVFINNRNLSENHYLTFGHNKLDYLKNYPMITVKAVTA